MFEGWGGEPLQQVLDTQNSLLGQCLMFWFVEIPSIYSAVPVPPLAPVCLGYSTQRREADLEHKLQRLSRALETLSMFTHSIQKSAAVKPLTSTKMQQMRSFPVLFIFLVHIILF